MTVEAVDAYLRQARALLGTGAPATMSQRPLPSATPAAPGSWNGAASSAAERPAELLHGHRGQLGDARDRAIQALDVGASIAADAHRGLDSIEAAWNSDKAALAPFADTPEGQAALTRAGIQRITETQTLVFDISTSFGDAAADVADATATLPTPPPGEAEADDPTGTDPIEEDPDSDPLSELTEDELPGDTAAWTGHDEDLHSAPISGPQSASSAAGSHPTGLDSALEALTGTGGLPSMGGAGAGMPTGAGSGLLSLLQPISDAAAGGADNFGRENDFDDDDELSTGTGAAVVRTAERALGLPYVWGGGGTTGPSGGGFDCSGLTQWAVAQATDGQVVLPRTTYDQIGMGRAVDPRDARVGDLVFSNFSAPGVPEHVQIYAGDGRVIEAQQSGVPVKYSTAPGGDIVVRRVL